MTVCFLFLRVKNGSKEINTFFFFLNAEAESSFFSLSGQEKEKEDPKKSVTWGCFWRLMVELHKMTDVWQQRGRLDKISVATLNILFKLSESVVSMCVCVCVKCVLLSMDSLPWHYKYPLVYTTAYPATKRQPGWRFKEEDWLTFLLLCFLQSSLCLHWNGTSDYQCVCVCMSPRSSNKEVKCQLDKPCVQEERWWDSQKGLQV